ncbi:hypothetical protein [Streptomyces sp. NPDC088915]|uniref:hypothetical protein n=1 Tax=Streptomyces sp. NPDC088915 TaxID=3365912 RepID=UPI003830C8E1
MLVTRRMRDPDPAVRSKGCLDLMETIGCLLLFIGLMLSFVVVESWFWITPIGFVLVTAAYVVKGIRRLRIRRSAAHPEHTKETANKSRLAGPQVPDDQGRQAVVILSHLLTKPRASWQITRTPAANVPVPSVGSMCPQSQGMPGNRLSPIPAALICLHDLGWDGKHIF